MTHVFSTLLDGSGLRASARPGTASGRKPLARLAGAAAVIVLALIAGCGASPASSEAERAAASLGQAEVLVLEVAPERVRCVGEMEGLCLQVRSPGDTEWRTFYNPIEGFEHEPGVRYRIEVARYAVPDPPADGSAYDYRLLRVLEQERIEP